ncbi:MAG: hypothetical protein Q7K55_01940 [Candidatus Levybacteria bacterium]|nr:hypothetical protein [Candidatus Levybacteria bacterium]
MNKLKILFISIYIFLLAIPLFTFINNSGFNDLHTYKFIRLFGLFGITLFFIQFILGAFMIYWRRLFGIWIFKFHITQGLIAYLIILLHPIFYFLNILQFSDFKTSILSLLPGFATNADIYLNFGKLGLIFLTIAIMAGIFRTYPLISKYWRRLHRLNYIVFVLIIIHSYFIGSDSKTVPFIFLYPAFIGGLILALFYKFKKNI